MKTKIVTWAKCYTMIDYVHPFPVHNSTGGWFLGVEQPRDIPPSREINTTKGYILS